MRYYVAKIPNGGFVGTYTFAQIVAQHQAGEIRDDYVVTESTDLSYAQLVKVGGAVWMTVQQLLAGAPPTSASAPATMRPQTEYIDRRSGWAIFLRVMGFVSILVSLVGILVGLASDSYQAGGIIFVFGLVAAIQSFFFAFMVDVFTDLRWFTKKLVDEPSRDA